MNNILIIKLGALGDVIMSTSLIQSIQHQHADDRLTLLTSHAFADIFTDWPGIAVQSFPRRGLINTWKTIHWIRQQAFDRVYDLQSNDRSRLYCLFAKTKETVGNHNVYPYTYFPEEPYAGQKHIFERMNDVLASAGLEPASPDVYLPLSDENKQRVLAWIERHLQEKPFVLLHAGASKQHPEKCWPYFAELAEQLAQQSVEPVWIGSSEDKEAIARLSQRVGVNACGQFSLNQLAELAKQARFAVTNDSGPMHALSGSGIPVFALFGPTNWRRNHALGQQDHVITLQTNVTSDKTITGAEAELANISCEMVLQRLRHSAVIA